jgi:hypothetical protein
MRINEIHCDRCEAVITKDCPLEWQEVMSYNDVGGFGSVFGDGVEWSIDLCQHCTMFLLGPYIRKDTDA